LPGTYGALEEYLFKVRPGRIHPALGVTPDEFQEARLKETGARDFRGVHLTEDFLLMTSPHARRPFHKVDRQRGVWVDGLWYRHPAMKDVRKSEKVEVRIEPWNASVIYVYVRDRWVAATGTNTRWLAGRTHREVEIALREEQRRAKLDANKDSVSKKSLKHKDKPWLPEAFDPRLAEQQREMQALYGPKGLTTAMPLPADVAAGVNSDSAAIAAAEPAASKPAAPSPEQTAPAVSNMTPPAPSVQKSQDAEPANESSYAALLRARAHYR
jgi:putative transposase